MMRKYERGLVIVSLGYKKNERLYYNDLTFSEKAPEANLPVRGRGGFWCGVVPLLSRRDLWTVTSKRFRIS